MSAENKEITDDIRANFSNATINIVKNRGYDIGPFIEVINKINLDKYDYIMKLHTKRNVKNNYYLGNGFNVSNNKWRKELLSFTKNFSKLIELFENKQTVGMVGGLDVIK